MDITRKVLLMVINGVLKLLHPFIPFLTDELHQMISKHFVNYEFKTILDTKWPNLVEINYDPKEDDLFKIHTEMVKVIRTVKAEYGLTKSDAMELTLTSDNSARRTPQCRSVASRRGKQRGHSSFPM